MADENRTSRAQTPSGIPLLGLGPRKKPYVPHPLVLVRIDPEGHLVDRLGVERTH